MRDEEVNESVGRKAKRKHESLLKQAQLVNFTQVNFENRMEVLSSLDNRLLTKQIKHFTKMNERKNFQARWEVLHAYFDFDSSSRIKICRRFSGKVENVRADV